MCAAPLNLLTALARTWMSCVSVETDVPEKRRPPYLKSFAYEYVIDAFDVNRLDGLTVESAITGFSFFTPRETVASVPYDRRIFKS